MTRTIILTIIAAAVGVVAGAVAVQQTYATRLNKALAMIETERSHASKYKQDADAAADKLRRTEAQIASMTDNARTEDAAKAELQQQLAAKQKELSKVSALAMGTPAGPEGKAHAEQNSPGGRRSGTAAQDATNEERRREVADRLKEGLENYMDTAISQAPDSTTADRLSTLGDYMRQQMELLKQMRDAKTDEDRQAARQALTDLRQNMRDLTQNQQDHVLRQLAAQYGITSPEKQGQFIQSLRKVQSGPFFRMGPSGSLAGMLLGPRLRSDANTGR